MRRERWVGASVNEQKGREERESDSYLYCVAVTKAKKEYGNFPRPCRIYSINIAQEKFLFRFLLGRGAALSGSMSRARTDFRRCRTIRTSELKTNHN